jgi:proline dehydrogenase
MFRLLDSPTYHTISTHDKPMLEAAQLYIRKHNIPKYRFEFESRMGMNPDYQKKLVADGYRVRIDVPYGEAWLGYLLRCLGDKSVGSGFVVANLLR